VTTKIRAAVLHAINEPLVIEELELDDPRPDEVLVQIKAAGLCHSDLHYINGSLSRPLPTVPGHEAAGVVLACGSAVKSVRPGDHVVPLFVPQCGSCESCLSGRTNLCRYFGVPESEPRIFRAGEPVGRSSTLGTFATHALANERSLVKVRSDAPFNRIFYCGCGVTTGVGAAVFDAKVQPGSSVIVFGIGGIGLNVLQGARLAGASTIVAVDTNSEREAMARKFGATRFFNPATCDGDVAAALLALTEGGADYSFECIGNTAVVEQAFNACHPLWGRCTVVGVTPNGKMSSFNPQSFLMGRSISGSIFGGAKGRRDIPRMVDWYMDGIINIDDLVTHRIKLDQINEGFDMMRSGESIRAVIEF
jgi:S-(hydroxymethyl)glutathione dehydrogenase/alcohol dehydrogenase